MTNLEVPPHWTDVIRLATSIHTGVISASVVLERLGSYPCANGLALALCEIDRVERTLFTLDWIERPEERRQATLGLNKGEAQNALRRMIFFRCTGRIRDHGLQAQGTPRRRAQSGRRSDRAVEYHLPRCRHAPPRLARSPGAARPAPAPIPARLAAHQIDRQLSLVGSRRIRR